MNKELSIVGLLLVLLILVLGIALLGFGVRNRINAGKSTAWPTVPGIITTSSMTEELDDDTLTRYRVSVIYDYTVHSKEYQGRNFRFRVGDFRDQSEAQAVLDKYPIDTRVKVFYHPDNPATSVLEPGGHGGAWFLIIPGVILLILGSGCLWMVLKG